MANDSFVTLQKILFEVFDDEGLQTLCYALGVDPGEIGGDTKTLRSWRIIHWFRQRERVSELIEQILVDRPNAKDDMLPVQQALAAAQAGAVAKVQPVSASIDHGAESGIVETSHAQTAAVASPIAAETMESVVRRYAKLLQDSTVFFLRTIPSDRLKGAYASYAQPVVNQHETPLVLVDTSMRENGSGGCLLTDKGIYIKDIFSAPAHLELRDVLSVNMTRDIFGGCLVLNGNTNVTLTALASVESVELLAQMLTECANIAGSSQ